MSSFQVPSYGPAGPPLAGINCIDAELEHKSAHEAAERDSGISSTTSGTDPRTIAQR